MGVMYKSYFIGFTQDGWYEVRYCGIILLKLSTLELTKKAIDEFLIKSGG